VHLENVSKIFHHGVSATSELIAAMSSDGGQDTQAYSKVAVDQLSLTISEGERLGIVGRNGAGKSTLLHLIAGISDPTSGTIRINGKVTSIMTLGVGLRDDLSGRENIYVDGEIQGKSRAEVDAVIDQVIEFSELGKFIDYPVRTYSTGMKARLAFSMITHIEPEILIIDEALSVGDAFFSAKATARILDICARGKIVILVSHGMQSILDICNRCIYLKDGRVVMDGLPDDVTKSYTEEVRGEDETALMERFSTHVGSRSHTEGYEIDHVSLFSGSNRTASVRVESVERLRVYIAGRIGTPGDYGFCCVRIVRLDDLLVFEQDFRFGDYSFPNGELSIEIVFAPLVLGVAIYRIDILFFLDSRGRGQQPLCEHSTIFEVFTLTPPSGGKPMLHYPVSAAVQP
jgi:lipopolysaccharide transport system ATP-binding protein